MRGLIKNLKVSGQCLQFLSRNVVECQINQTSFFSLKLKPSFKFEELNVRLAAPHQLKPKPDLHELRFGHQFTDHMLKVLFVNGEGGWQVPEITPLENLVLHPAAKVLHYAIELFEGMKAFRGVDGQIRLFRPEKNMERMNRTALRASLPQFSIPDMLKCLDRLVAIDQEWVPHSEASSLYIRPSLIGIDPALGVSSCEQAMLFILMCPVASYFDKSDSSVSLLADPQYTRAWPGGCGDKKMGSNYAPTINVQREASKKGMDQVLWLFGPDHWLTEAGTMNIFVVYESDNGRPQLVTHPLDGIILPGINRMSIMELAKSWPDVDIHERPIGMPEIVSLLERGKLRELFGSGTACTITAISRLLYINQYLEIPTLKYNLHKRFRAAIEDIQYGRVDHHWAHIIR